MPNIISLFSGCGGLDLGFEQEGYTTVWANDFKHEACVTFENHFGPVIHEGDIEKIDPYNDHSIPDCDIILGGFPCQDFSIIWKQPGLNGERGNLYKSLLRFIDAKHPKAFVAENVKGILTANKGKAIQQIITDFQSLNPGYLIKPHLYNFADYGVPQFRERVLIVGIRLDTGFYFEHPQPTHGEGQGLIRYVSAGQALKGVEDVPYNNEHLRITERTRNIINMIPEGGNYTDIPVESPYYVHGMISHVYRRINRNEPSKTIIASGGGGTWGYHFPEPRPLTNRERARIQSFPDDFHFYGSTTEVRRQIGNAVPPVGVHAIARALRPLFDGIYEPVDLYAEQYRLSHLSINERIKLF
ncbi:MAG: DNA cytosine methyltransferase [Paludibacteraceae bacterium]|nr:DNA cytosine methyltransferase [Paludibacteraceae bacterium]MBQ8715263.1 DNA cytosine methyltransferase [Prevotella sp.]